MRIYILVLIIFSLPALGRENTCALETDLKKIASCKDTELQQAERDLLATYKEISLYSEHLTKSELDEGDLKWRTQRDFDCYYITPKLTNGDDKEILGCLTRSTRERIVFLSARAH